MTRYLRWSLFRRPDPSVFLVAILVIMSSSSSSSSGNRNSDRSVSSSSSRCDAFPIHPWNSRLTTNSQRTSRRRRTSSSSLASTTEDAAQTTTTTTPIVNGSRRHDDNINNNLKTSEVLSLDSIRASLIRQEETIIFALIERAQFRHNPVVYRKGGLGSLGTPPGGRTQNEKEELSFLEYMLVGTEALHFAVRRYTSPEEHGKFAS